MATDARGGGPQRRRRHERGRPRRRADDHRHDGPHDGPHDDGPGAPGPADTAREGVVERLVPGGHGLLRDGDGVVFVDGVVPSERVRYSVVARRGGARHGRLLAVVQPSPARAVPGCRHAVAGDGVDDARACGGCDWLHMDDDARARGKEALVDDALLRIARLPPALVATARAPLPALDLRDPGSARRRVRLHIDDDGRAGFHARRSRALVVVDDCPALDARLRAVLPRLPRLGPGGDLRLAVDDAGCVVAAVDDADDARALHGAGVVDGVVVPDRGARRRSGDDGVDDARALDDRGRDRATWGDPLLRGEVTAGMCQATSDAASFTQATRHGGRAILDAVVDAVAVVVAGAGRPGIAGAAVLELFAGSGHLTLPLARAGARVDAVEGDARGFRFLVDNVDRFCPAGSVRPRRAFIDPGLPIEDAVDVVVADPPRTGIPGAAALFARCRAAGAAGLVLVSCDPATGARDLRAALDAGFVLQRVVPLDAFPGTHHVEWVATLTTTR
jgi:23S rRNA (uracil1939-C5)-methyltransferase